MNLKELLGQEIAKRVKNNSLIGIGTGSTVECAIKEISNRIKEENLKISVVSTSISTTRLCESLGFTVLSDTVPTSIDFSFDGADAVDRQKRAIKGKGGALLREKILASVTKDYVIIADESKFADNIVKKSLVPIEVNPLAMRSVEKILTSNFNIKNLTLRMAEKKYGEIITEFGNVIFDVEFDSINNETEKELNSVPGIIENGIFTHFATEILISKNSGKVISIK